MTAKTPQPKVTAKAKLSAKVAGVYLASGESFVTEAVEAPLELAFDGLPGDLHAGVTRKSGGREPWYKRGTEMRNERQISLVCPEDMAEIAQALGVPEVKPEWIGANALISGIANFSYLPPDTLMFFEGGLTLVVQRQNAPCKFAGAAIGKNYPDYENMETAFPKAAKRLRGLVAWVEKPGPLYVDQGIVLRLPEQWIYEVPAA